MALNTKVGTFTKRTTVGDDVIALAAGFDPGSITFFYSDITALAAWADGYRFAWGVSDGTSHGCYASTSADLVVPLTVSNTAHHVSATKALVVIDADGVVIASATVTFAIDSVTVSWDVNAAPALVIGYRVIGGSDYQGKVLNKNQQLSPANDYAITGVGFRPDLVECILGALESPGSAAGTNLVFGAFDKDLGNASITVRAVDNVNPSSATRAFSTTTALRDSGGSMTINPVSMDADGFTINSNPGHSTRAIVFLCHKVTGQKAKVVSFQKSTGGAPASQSITSVGFGGAVALFFWTHITQDNTVVNSARIGMSAVDAAVNKAAVVALDLHNSDPSNTHSHGQTNKAIFTSDNATPSVAEETDLTWTATGFDLVWDPTTAAARRFAATVIGETPAPVVAGSRGRRGRRRSS